MYADIIIKNGRCVTMCGDGGADWVAAAGKMICDPGLVVELHLRRRQRR